MMKLVFQHANASSQPPEQTGNYQSDNFLDLLQPYHLYPTADPTDIYSPVAPTFEILLCEHRQLAHALEECVEKIGEVLAHAGIIKDDMHLTGPELLAAADRFISSYSPAR
jgi:hypothetical protein